MSEGRLLGRHKVAEVLLAALSLHHGLVAPAAPRDALEATRIARPEESQALQPRLPQRLLLAQRRRGRRGRGRRRLRVLLWAHVASVREGGLAEKVVLIQSLYKGPLR